MLDFEVKRCSRRCVVTDQELAPGDAYYSVLEVDGAEVVRRDYSAAAWNGPPESAIGWWESRVPLDGATKPKLAPGEVALELFDRWVDSPEMHDAVYVLSLFLVRKRVFRFAETGFDAQEADPNRLQFHCPARGAEYDVTVVDVSAERAAAIQEQLVTLLYSDAA